MRFLATDAFPHTEERTVRFFPPLPQAAWNYYERNYGAGGGSDAFSEEERASWNARKKGTTTTPADEKR